ncbi:MAG: glycosyltransferase [Actinomycetia bacterium]|nr:glycosyltransferase [Actinomycetes bacterium]
MTWPDPPFRHLLRLTDHVALLEHTEGIVPRHEHGYCVDDAARGLMIVCREPSPRDELVTLARRYLHFLAQAQAPDGRFRNRLGYDRRWKDQPGTGDCWGRALWGLGTAAARGPAAVIRDESLARFDSSAQLRSEWPHAMAFAALGAVEVLDILPGHPAALGLLAAAVGVIGEPAENPAWRWPAPRLSYANAAIAEAVIVAGWKLGDDRVLRSGLGMLDWLLAGETHDGHLSVVPAGGWGQGERRPRFDQQPIEVAALADACARAAEVTGDTAWLSGVAMSVAWFLGDNDTKTPMLNPHSGGGHDGLGLTGRNRNQGAESTLAMISVLQQGRRVSAVLR